ncbi:hypothetical protein CHI08_02325 [Peribacillus simplex]|nr:hypothetical protein CHI08_02325 [Peribacillus simplex]
MYHQLLRVYKNENCDIIILEEGILQYIANIPYVSFFNNNKILKDLLLSMLAPVNNLLIVNCDIEYKESIQRIYHRGLKDRRFDVMEEEELLSGLKENYRFFIKMRQICNNMVNVKLDMSDEVNENVELLVKKIYEKLG